MQNLFKNFRCWDTDFRYNIVLKEKNTCQNSFRLSEYTYCTYITLSRKNLLWEKSKEEVGNKFDLRWIFGTNVWQLKKFKILGAILEVPAKQPCKSSQFSSFFGELAGLAGLFSC